MLTCINEYSIYITRLICVYQKTSVSLKIEICNRCAKFLFATRSSGISKTGNSYRSASKPIRRAKLHLHDRHFFLTRAVSDYQFSRNAVKYSNPLSINICQSSVYIAFLFGNFNILFIFQRLISVIEMCFRNRRRLVIVCQMTTFFRSSTSYIIQNVKNTF